MSVLHSAELALAERFYRSAFGWELQQAPDVPVGLWRLPGYHGGVGLAALSEDVVAVAAPAAPPSVPPHWAVSVFVGDVGATLEAAVGRGATVVVPPTDSPGLRSAAFADPQGAVLSVTAATSS